MNKKIDSLPSAGEEILKVWSETHKTESSHNEKRVQTRNKTAGTEALYYTVGIHMRHACTWTYTNSDRWQLRPLLQFLHPPSHFCCESSLCTQATGWVSGKVLNSGASTRWPQGLRGLPPWPPASALMPPKKALRDRGPPLSLQPWDYNPLPCAPVLAINLETTSSF